MWPLDLQRLAGNRAVALVVDQIAQRLVQRVAVKEAPPDETLYNQPGSGREGRSEEIRWRRLLRHGPQR